MDDRLDDGTLFGRYRIEGLIASGGMGQVYAARDDVYGDVVALKVLHESLHSDEGWRARFNEEGLVGTQLKHPHILSARELVENEGRVALVVDLVQGGQTLEKVMAREFRDGIAIVTGLRVFLRILQGMDYLHGKGIVHGDLKPENVMIEGDFRRPETWTPKVTDFGTVALIAHPVEIDGRPAVVATPRYASPEHLYGVDRIEVRSDVYCLGLILHFVLSGRHVSNAQNVREAADRVMLPVPIVNLVDQPEPLVAVFKRATAADPAERFESVRAVAIAIRGVLEAIGADIERADLAADLATEVDEERARQRAEAARSSAEAADSPSMAATEPAETPTPASPRPPDPGPAAGADRGSSSTSGRSQASDRPRPSEGSQPSDRTGASGPSSPRTADPSPPTGSTGGAVQLSPDDVKEPIRKPTPAPAPGRTTHPRPKPDDNAIPWFVFGAIGLVVVILVAIAVGLAVQ